MPPPSLDKVILRVAAEQFVATDLYKYLKESFVDEDISLFFKGFYKFFYDKGYEYDINGFTLTFFYPPHLSGAHGVGMDGHLINQPPPTVLENLFLDFIVFSLEFSQLDINVEKTSIGLMGNETFDYATHVHSSGDVNLTYLDTDRLRFFTYHSYWIKYIHGVILGHLVPDSIYVDGNIIDYMGSLYSIKFDADMLRPRLISKALGIYPNSLPIKDVIGNRTQHQISVSNITYNCAYFYEEPIYGWETQSQSGFRLYREFRKNYEGLFKKLLGVAI